MNAIDYRFWELNTITAVRTSNPDHVLLDGGLPDVILLEVKVNDWDFKSTDVVLNAGGDGTTMYSIIDAQMIVCRQGTTCTIPVADWPRAEAGLDAINAKCAKKVAVEHHCDCCQRRELGPNDWRCFTCTVSHPHGLTDNFEPRIRPAPCPTCGK